MTRRSAGPGSADSFASARQLALVARPVFDQLRFWLPALPAKRSPLVDGMEGVDDHDRTPQAAGLRPPHAGRSPPTGDVSFPPSSPASVIQLAIPAISASVMSRSYRPRAP